MDTKNFTDARMSPLRAAEHALDTVQDDPAAARETCRQLLADLSATDGASDPAQRATRAVALWALGRAEYELGELRQSRGHLRQGIGGASRIPDPALRSAIRSSLAVTLLELGDTTGALQQLAEALPDARPKERGRVLKQRAFVWYTLGRYDRSLEDADTAFVLIEQSGDRLGLARLLINRGICHLALGSLSEAERDLTSCRTIAVELDQHLIVAACDQNLGCLHAVQRRLPEALRALTQARAEYDRLGSPGRVMSALDADLAGALLAAGLHGEAVDAAQRSLDEATLHANRVQVAEARLMLATALAAAGRAGDATTQARIASRLFRQSQRHGAVTFAEYTALEASAATMHLDTAVAAGSGEMRRRVAAQRRAAELVGELDRHGWRLEATHARTLAGTLACASGDLETARALLTSGASHTASASQQVRRYHSLARLCLLEGNVSAARRALRNGLAAVDAQRALLGATELRVHSAASASALAATGLEVALGRGRAADVLEWSEHGRAASLRSEPLRPPTDTHLAGLLATLRRTQARRVAAVGSADELPTGAELVKLERQIIERTRQLPASSGADRAIPSVADLGAQLGDRVLISFHEHRGQVGAVVVVQGRATLHDLGAVQRVLDEQAYMDSAVRRSLIAAGRAPSAASWRIAAQRFDDVLLAPLLATKTLSHLRESGDQSIVIVPTGSLHTISWGLLPSLRTHPFVVAPSTAAWYHRGALPSRTGPRRVGVAVGPGLPGAEREGQLVGELHDSTTVLVGEQATVQATLAMLRSCELVHLSAHGRFRNDSPLFSAVDLHDGPLTVVDLELLGSVAGTIVLPVCNAATASVHSGDELIGTTAAMLRIGVRTVVAPVRPIPDEASVDVMLQFHRLLLRGYGAARALAILRAGSADDDLVSLAAGLLSCFGAD